MLGVIASGVSSAGLEPPDVTDTQNRIYHLSQNEGGNGTGRRTAEFACLSLPSLGFESELEAETSFSCEFSANFLAFLLFLPLFV